MVSRPAIGRVRASSALEQYAAEFGTPLLVHDLAVLRSRAASLQAVLPAGSTLLYSLKANPLPPVVAALQQAGCGCEVSSLAELGTAIGGAASRPVLYTGPGKSSAEIGAATDAGALLSVESAAELARIRPSRARDRSAVLLRIQPAASSAAALSMADGSQFGLLEPEAVSACRQVGDEVDLLGFHVYLGSQLPSAEAMLAGFERALEAVDRVAAAAGVVPRVVDLGGGFAWPNGTPGSGPDLTPLGAGLASLLAGLRSSGAELWFESGRSLVAAAGRLLTTVLDVKARSGTTVVVVDAGINILGGMSGLGRVLRPSVGFRNLTHPERETQQVDVVGPLCTPLDRLAVDARVAAPQIGDVLCVENVGAYASTASLAAFLSRPPAVELVIGDDAVEAWTLRSGHVQLPLPDRGVTPPAAP